MPREAMKIYSSEPIDIPTDQNLTELLHTTAHPDIPESHLISKDNLTNRSITLGELRDRAGRLARFLSETFNPPDQARWVLSLPNSVDFLELSHAILWTGGVVCPINHALKTTEIGHGIAVSRPHYVITYGPILDKTKEAIAIANNLITTTTSKTAWSPPPIITAITLPNPPISPSSSFSSTYNHCHISHLSTPLSSYNPLPIPHNHSTLTRQAAILLSSGTTGLPKGVLLTHHNLVSQVHQLVRHDRQTPSPQFVPDSRTVAFTPWVHVGMFTIPLFLAPHTGMFHHAMPAYSPGLFGQLAQSNRATSFQGVPSVVAEMARGSEGKIGGPEKWEFGDARVVNVGGTKGFGKEMMERLHKRAPWRLCCVYGMTEGAGYVAYQRFGKEDDEGMYLLPGIEGRLMVSSKNGRAGEEEEDAEEGGPGELWIRGPNIFKGYAFNEEADEKAFKGGGHDGGNQCKWYNTGDVCTIDKEGRLEVVGRTKELIKYKGFQVSPAELEGYVNAHPDVLEGGVGAVWDEAQLTELPTAWVVLKEECQKKKQREKIAILKAIGASVDEKVSGYKKLRGGVWEVTKLPKNPQGKIVKKTMVEMKDGAWSLTGATQKAKI